MSQKGSQSVTRRVFIQTAAASATATFGAKSARAAEDKIRVGLVGCGGRGTGAANNCVLSAPNVELYAMADLFEDRIVSSLNALQGVGRKNRDIGNKLNVSPGRCFVGWDAYRQLLDTDVDLVILATPPQFRPRQFQAAVEAGKHAFIEKPVAVDPIGARSIMASSELAKRKGLAVAAGTQRRHAPAYIEVMKRIHDGAIGDIVGGQCYWNTGGLWVKERDPRWSDMEYQIRNWLYYTWLSGDHIVEQHLHYIDVLNWAHGGPPAKILGMGGRQSRIEAQYGNVFDHFAVEFEYPNGSRVTGMCRQAEGASKRSGERIVGTKGIAVPSAGRIEGENPYRFDGLNPNPQVQEHANLIASMRAGEPLNEGRRVAESTLTAIAGRMSAYTGRELNYAWVLNNSKLDLSPKRYEFGPKPVDPVATPGKTPLV